MKNLETLQERVKKMVDGEQKRREVALEWLDKVTSVLEEPCYEVLGNMSKYWGEETFAVSVWHIKGEKKTYHSVFFSYENTGSPAGFYMADPSDDTFITVHALKDTIGSDFWRAIKNIITWLPLIEADLLSRSKVRNLIVEKLLV